jgi:hypothetical protein
MIPVWQIFPALDGKVVVLADQIMRIRLTPRDITSSSFMEVSGVWSLLEANSM